MKNMDDAIVYGRIFKNGSPYGTERMHEGNYYVEYSEDLSFLANDECQLYLKRGSGSIVQCRNFRVYNNVGPFTEVVKD